MIIGRFMGFIGRLFLAICGVLLVGLIWGSIFAPQDTASASVPETVIESGRIYYDSLPTGEETVANYATSGSWQKNPVTYSIKNCPRTLDCNLAQQAVREAVEAWDAACGLRLDEIATVGDIEISWEPRSHGDGQPFDGPGNILGHAFYPNFNSGSLAGDVHLDDAETWVYDPPTAPLQIHLRTVVMHEVGHALGLKHSKDQTALMWPEYGDDVQGLAADDIAGIQSLYGPPGSDEAGITPVPTPDGLMAVAATTVRVRSGPGTSFPIVGRIPGNTAVVVLGRNADSSWLFVDYFGVQGWAASHLFAINGDLNIIPVVDKNGNGSSPLPPTLAPTTPSGGSPTGITATAKITARVRSGPGTGYLMVARIMTGESVPVLGRNADNTWLYIDVGGVQGWVSTRLFIISGDLNSVPVTVP